MSWTKLDDALLESAKWGSISEGAFCLGIRALCWTRKPAQLRKRPGFVPSAMLQSLARRSKQAAGKLARELVEAGQGIHDFGIWTPVEGGWMIHDFHEYGPQAPEPPAGEETQSGPSVRSTAASVAGQASAAARRARTGSAQPVNERSNVTPNVRSNEPPNDSRTSPNDSFERSPNVGRSSSQDLSRDLQDPETSTTKEKPVLPKTCRVIPGASAGADTGGLTELGSTDRKQGARPRFAALLAPTRLTARELAIPDSVRAYAFEIGLDTNAVDDVIVDWRDKVTEAQSADRLVSVLFRFIEKKANGSKPAEAAVPPAERAERERASQQSQREHESWKAEQERKATETARVSLRARGIDPDKITGPDLKKAIASVG